MRDPTSSGVLVAVFLSVNGFGFGPAANALADESHNVRLVGYHDMQGRQALQVTTKSDAANGNWVYVGHVPNTRTRDATLNPITGENEWNGTSILEISDPANPELVWHIPNDVNANSRSVSVVYDYEFDSTPPGRDYLIKRVWIAYLNAGVRVLDISDPQNLREVGYYIPKTNASPRPSGDLPRAIELTDVDIDHRGLVYASDRSGESCVGQGESCVGTGLFVFEYTGAPR